MSRILGRAAKDGVTEPGDIALEFAETQYLVKPTE
jgi:hypothetical protein